MAAELLGAESDRRLVERVLATRDESALLTIVLRHGAMVYHVCRRVLRHPQDAEDAFQATFLVLAQELHTVRKRNSLAGWLHGVALRVSRKARARAAARQRREAGAARPEAVSPDDLTWGEVRSALDDELSRLPDRLRLPLVLCYLEGRTQDEAADQLGWSKSTLRRRLEQARGALGSRLKGRGIAWSAALPAVMASDSLAATATPPTCVDSTVAAALAVVNGKPLALAASAEVTVLTEGVLITMSVTRIGVVAGALIVLTLATAAVGGHFFAAPAAQAEVQPEDGPALPVGSFPMPERASARAEEPKRAEKPEPLTLKGHTGEVWSVCFSPDGKRILTGGGALPRGGAGVAGGAGGDPPGPGEVKVWDAENGTEILALKGHTGMVHGVCFSPDGKRIATAGAFEDETVRVWDAEKGHELFTLKGQTQSTGSVCFRPDGKRIATISLEHVKVWDAGKGQELLTLKADVRPTGSVCFSPNGRRIASVYPWSRFGRSVPAEIKVWDAEKGQELLALKGHTGEVLSVCFSPDGKRLASAGLEDQTVRVWDAEKGEELLALKGHSGPVSSACFSPDGKRIITASWDQTVKVWDAVKGRELLTLKGHTGLVRSVCFSPDGKRLASASGDKTVNVWSLDKEE
ncbi:sigma-70 family RNA polymerase sigma factor [Frigoriglobus tundricola]|nr:sigma-70 family RNA polymerase sigma factor [Frigoriglobus tundricola]